MPLGYGRSYTVITTGRGADDVTRAPVSTFTTLVPGNQTALRLTTTGKSHDPSTAAPAESGLSWSLLR